MKAKPAKSLTWAVVSAHGDRKKPGRVSVIVNAATGAVYPVPRDVEHKDYICSLVHTTPETLRANPSYIAALIPVHIDLDAEHCVVGVLTGLSGFEEVYKVRHAPADLLNAHKRALEFVFRGELRHDDSLESRAKIDYRYAG